MAAQDVLIDRQRALIKTSTTAKAVALELASSQGARAELWKTAYNDLYDLRAKENSVWSDLKDAVQWIVIGAVIGGGVELLSRPK